MQMMLNIAGTQDDRTAATQRRLQGLARTLSGPARAGFERAASLTRNARERELLLDRARACAGAPT